MNLGTHRLGVGDPAPDFTLAGTDGTSAGHREYSLAEYRGHPVVLVFYPADNSPVCTVQLTQYTSNVADLRDVGAHVLALSPQSVETHDEFAAKQGGFAFPLLADEDKAVGRRYGILGPMGFYRRSIFVVDRDGIVRYSHRSVTSLAFQPSETIVAALREI
ncbi:MAG TPA: peroxiredoxin [Acidimicrobiales bacterium]|nr:peroxiredoxin [Acidimicrobiales bacterium]